MILVIGGYAAGKRTFVKERFGFDEGDMADAAITDKPVVFNAQKLAVKDGDALSDVIEALSRKEVVIACELGLGIIPMEKADREARERAGRMTNRLAQRADTVIRIVAGLPIYLKGSAE